jgi:hypothetical protein
MSIKIQLEENNKEKKKYIEIRNLINELHNLICEAK